MAAIAGLVVGILVGLLIYHAHLQAQPRIKYAWCPRCRILLNTWCSECRNRQSSSAETKGNTR